MFTGEQTPDLMVALPDRCRGAAHFTDLVRVVCAAVEGEARHGEPSFELLTQLGRVVVCFAGRPATAATALVIAAAEPAAGAGVELTFDHRPDRLTGTAARRLAGHLRTLLGAIADDPFVPLAEVELLAAGEKRLVVTDFNDTGRTVPPVPWPELFEAQVPRTPTHPRSCTTARRSATRSSTPGRTGWPAC